MKKFFLTTRQVSKDLDKAYDLIISSAKKNFEDIYRVKTELQFLKLDKSIKVKVFIFFIYKFFCILLNKNLIFKLKFKDIELSTYIIAQIYKNYKSYQSKLIFYKSLLMNLYTAARIISTVERLPKNIVAAYLDHGAYINGILFQCLSKKRIVIYSNNLPRGLFKINFKKIKSKITYSKALQLDKSYNLNDAQKKLVKKILNNIIYKNKVLPWIKRTGYQKDFKNDYSDFTHVIYAQSFTDAQLIWGNDGFLNTKDWLLFTIKELLKNKKNKILLKSHPNFYNKSMGNQAIWDKIIFDSLKKKIIDKKNLVIIDRSIKNSQILKKLNNKKTILISHHSSSMLEGIYFGFKCISSDKTFWNTSNFRLTNNWSNKHKYELLLKKKWDQLYKANFKDFNSVVYEYFLNDYHLEGKKYFFNIINKIIKIKNYNELVEFQNSGLISNISYKKSLNVIKNLSKNIENLNIKK